jgi:nucleotide-binding universal stress UspA family protein
MSGDRVVVGIDGSTSSRDALVWAAREARLRGVSLLVVHSRFRPSYDPVFASGFYPPGSEPDDDGVLDLAAEVVAKVEPGLTVSGVSRSGPAALVLLDVANEGAGLVVVGSRGLGAFGAFFLGSVSVHLAARSPAPVVVVPSGTEFSTAGPVLVAVDGSAGGEAATVEAAREALLRGVPLDVIATYLVPADPLVTSLSPSVDDFRGAFRARAHEVAEAAAEQARAVDSSLIVRTHVAEGAPAREIVKAATAGSAALVVVGSRGHGEVVGPVLGSVSQGVLRHATTPVLVAHQR